MGVVSVLILCLLSLVVGKKRITNGQDAVPGGNPNIVWQAKLVIAQRRGCGGTIINSRTILTAAHCVHDISSGTTYNPRSIAVCLGTNSNACNQNLVGHSMWIHQSYINTQPRSTRIDMAALHLTSDIDFSDPNIGPAAIAPATCIGCEQIGSQYIVSGFGNQDSTTSSSDNPSATLKYVRQEFVDRVTCDAAAGFTMLDTAICAGPVAPETGTDSCQGDSGGPMVYFDSGVATVVGVVSEGTGGGNSLICGGAGEYGIYTSVQQNNAWVVAVSNNDTSVGRYFSGTESGLVGDPVSAGGIEIWVIIIAVVGGLAVLIALIAICCCLSKRKTQNYQRNIRSAGAAPQRTQGSIPVQQRAAPPQGSHPPPRPVSPAGNKPPVRPEYQTTVAQTAAYGQAPPAQAPPVYPQQSAYAGTQSGFAVAAPPAYGGSQAPPPNASYGADLGYAPQPPVQNSQPAVYTPSNVVYTPQQTGGQTSTPYGNI